MRTIFSVTEMSRGPFWSLHRCLGGKSLETDPLQRVTTAAHFHFFTYFLAVNFVVKAKDGSVLDNSFETTPFELTVEEGSEKCCLSLCLKLMTATEKNKLSIEPPYKLGHGIDFPKVSLCTKALNVPLFVGGGVFL